MSLHVDTAPSLKRPECVVGYIEEVLKLITKMSATARWRFGKILPKSRFTRLCITCWSSTTVIQHRLPVMPRVPPPGSLSLDMEKNPNTYLPPPISVLPGLHVSSSKALSVKKTSMYPKPYDPLAHKSKVCTSNFSK